MKRTALLYADKNPTGLAGFARVLEGLGFDLVAPTSTTKFLEQQGIGAKDVAIFGRMIPGCPLALIDHDPNTARVFDRLNTGKVELVYAPLLKIEECEDFDVITAQVDVENVSLLLAAIRSRKIVVCDPPQFDRVIHCLRSNIIPGTSQEMAHLAGVALEAITERCRILAWSFESCASDKVAAS